MRPRCRPPSPPPMQPNGASSPSDRDYQGQGHAGDLVQYALKAALHISEVIGAVGVVTHPLDDAVREFYRQFGFEDLPFDPRRAMIVRMVDLEREFGQKQ
ncbi:MAG: GNAT family N-acetyltransferase [Hyphomicrobiales bacterium]|nr:GNAT family N-acetyltransferase [Hyphomicrobiales bacterium]